MTVWWRVLRAPVDGRLTVQCVECGEYFWPTAREVFAWTVCAHCAGWWTFDGNPRPR